MNENLLPDVGDIRIPADWKKIPSYSSRSPFLVEQIEFAKRILDKCDASAFTLGTLHGICASAIHPIERRYGYQAVRELQVAHLREDPKPVLDAFDRIADGLCLLGRAYAELGVDGIYYAALGAERELFTDEEFARWIAPFDQRILREVKAAGCYAFLHMCKGNLNLRRYAGYSDLADVVNWGVYENGFSLEEGRSLFGGKCVMGGLANRSGVPGRRGRGRLAERGDERHPRLCERGDSFSGPIVRSRPEFPTSESGSRSRRPGDTRRQ